MSVVWLSIEISRKWSIETSCPMMAIMLIIVLLIVAWHYLWKSKKIRVKVVMTSVKLVSAMKSSKFFSLVLLSCPLCCVSSPFSSTFAVNFTLRSIIFIIILSFSFLCQDWFLCHECSSCWYLASKALAAALSIFTVRSFNDCKKSLALTKYWTHKLKVELLR